MTKPTTPPHNPGDLVVSRVQANIKHLMPEQGMNSNTYLAHDPHLAVDVVLKEVEYKTPADAKGVLEEAQRLRAMHHPHVAATQYATDDGTSIVRVVMPHYARGSLDQMLASGPLPISDALRYTGHVLLALGHVHSRGLLHADVKPSNVLLNDNDHAILTDFGQSVFIRPTDQLADRPRMYGGAFPPEAVNARSVSLQVDVYQVGVMLYRLINGKAIWKIQSDDFAARDLKGTVLADVAAGRWPDRDLWLPHIPVPLRTVIRKAMHIDTGRRYATVDELGNALRSLVIEPKVGSCQVNEAGSGWTWTHRNGPQEYITSLRQDQKGRWDIVSTRTNTSTKATDTLHRFSKAGITNRALAFGHLKTRFEQA